MHVSGLLVALVTATAACSSPAPLDEAVPTPTSTPTTERSPQQRERCVEEAIENSDHDPVVGADLAAWEVEDLLPPPLQTAGLQSGDTTILLDGEPVGEVVVEETEPGIFVATAFSYCVPPDLELATVDVVDTFGGSWQLVGSTPELDLPEDAEMRLTVRDGYFGGWAACNEYSAQPAAGPDGQLRLSNVFFTEAGCVEDEQIYQDLLETADRWALEGGQLVLAGPQGELRYEPAPTEPVAVSSATVSPDGRELRLGIDICQNPLVGLQVDEGRDDVRVQASTTAEPDPSDCAQEHVVTLDEPLGDRAVVDVSTGEPVAVQPDQ